MAVISSTDIHYYDSTDMNSKIIVIIFRPEMIENRSTKQCSILPFIRRGELNNMNEKAYSNFSGIFKSIVEEMHSGNQYFQLYVSGKILELYSLLLRHFSYQGNDVRKKVCSRSDILKMQTSIKYMEDNYMYDISLSHISGKLNISPSYFSKLFSEYTGKTFIQYLNLIRISKAQMLIKTSDSTIIDIAFNCGFNSVRSFNRTFKTVNGYPPSKARRL